MVPGGVLSCLSFIDAGGSLDSEILLQIGKGRLSSMVAQVFLIPVFTHR